MARGSEVDTESGGVPESVMDSVNTTLSNLHELRSNFEQFLPLINPKILSQIPPLQRAQSLFLLSKITSTLLTLKLRCNGVQPNDHPVKSELDRLDLYQDKLERLLDLNKAPLRPSTTLNHQAATRFIEHSLPDLTSEQRQQMRNISRGEGQKRRHQERAGKKRKIQSSERPSVQAIAKEFLEKAQRELLGGNNGGIRGPLQIDKMSEGDDDEINNIPEDD
ncbi:nuclear nucleic acid-binding protein C1D [Trifolium repens]|jgi:exosome complex protein LRP1|nr:nuclear nucleic acid-binding protein C1D [Trifolium repens]